MNSLVLDAKAEKIWFDSENLWVSFYDGRQLSVPLAYFPRLLKANVTERENFIISGGGVGIHWDALDEDISVPMLLKGFTDRNKKA